MKVCVRNALMVSACVVAAICATGRAEDVLSLDPFAGAPEPALVPAVATADAGAVAGPLSLATLDAVAVSPADKLSLSFELPIWFSGLDGTVGVRGFTVPVNASFLDILDATDSVIGMGGRIEADYGPWIFSLDGLYLKLTTNTIPVGPARIDFIAELAIADAGIMYQLGRWNLGAAGASFNPAVAVAAGAGARYMHVGMELNTQGGLSRKMTQDWADPLALLQVKLDLNEHWQLLFRGDIGGGCGADLTWSTTATVAYRFKFTDKISGAVKLGYEAISEDYTNGSGNQQFVWNAIMHGPVIAFEVGF